MAVAGISAAQILVITIAITLAEIPVEIPAGTQEETNAIMIVTMAAQEPRQLIQEQTVIQIPVQTI